MKYAPLLVALLAGAPSRSEAVTVQAGIPYSSTPSHARSLDLYLPDVKAGQVPLLVFVHGGAWVSGDRRDYADLGRAFARGGVAVAIPNYRLAAGPGSVRHPAFSDDIVEALSWLAAHAKTYRFGAVVLAGHSAGAHIAATIALSPAYAKAMASVVAVVGLEGIYDLPELVRVWPAYLEAFVAKAFGRDPAAWAKASPSEQVRRTRAAWMIVHSVNDELVDDAQSVVFAGRLSGAGNRLEAAPALDTDHFGAVAALANPDSPLHIAVRGLLKPEAKKSR